jgi:hypothetical protein
MGLKYGYFVGSPKTVWSDNDSWMTMLEDFEYVDKNGKHWLAPKNIDIDGTSIPRIFWSAIGDSPYTGKMRKAGVIHDCQCVIKVEPWFDVHEMFYWACLACGVSDIKSKVAYYSVYHFGPRWIQGKSIASSLLPSIEKINETVEFIKTKKLSLDDIREIEQ